MGFKIYTVGPVTGVEDWKKPFKEARESLLKDFYTVLSPLDYPEGLSYREYMMLSVQNVFIADAVCVLPGWERSKGAAAEVALADSINTAVWRYPERRIFLRCGNA